ncbi:hypothetical protein Q5752_003868 [Cryptotrichosporon argae]
MYSDQVLKGRPNLPNPTTDSRESVVQGVKDLWTEYTEDSCPVKEEQYKSEGTLHAYTTELHSRTGQGGIPYKDFVKEHLVTGIPPVFGSDVQLTLAPAPWAVTKTD